MTGRSRGFGLVTFASEEEAMAGMPCLELMTKAVAGMNERDVDGRAIRCKISKDRPREDRPPQKRTLASFLFYHPLYYHSSQVEQEHGIFSPYADEWKLGKSEIERAEKLFAQDYPQDYSQATSKLLLFLYAKGLLAKMKSVVRRTIFNDLLEAETPELQEALGRLKTIVEIGETAPARAEMNSMFDEFVASHPEWDRGHSFVAFRDHPRLRGKSHALVERLQRSGLCYMHAGVVVQHYLVAMSNDGEVPMLNIAEYLKKYMSGDSLYEHIWNNKGGDSLGFLKKILKEKPRAGGIVSRYFSEVLRNNDLDRLLMRYGPGLVSGFAVAEEFTRPDWQHLGNYTVEESKGYHAMVLVGYRVVDGKKRYLLQNWWESKPYVEVDVDYLRSSDASVHFVKKKQMEMGDYPTNHESLVECDPGIDASENFNPETK
jgi:hypothetical protein